MKKILLAAGLFSFIACAAYAIVLSPPISTFTINGHTYTNEQWEANFQGTLAAVAADIAAVTVGVGTSGVSTNAELKSLTAGTYSFMMRHGFYTAGDSPATVYRWSSSPCSFNGGNGDDGAQVAPNAGTGCWVADLSSGNPSILIWGADPTGTVNAAPFFQAAYNAMGPVGKCVYVPQGTYLINTQVVMADHPPCFKGDGFNEAEGASGTAKRGTWIHITNIALQPFAISSLEATGAGYGFYNMAFFQDQPTPAVGWTPSPYQYVFTVNDGGQGLTFENLYFYNITNCFSSWNSGRLHLRKWSGQPLGTCILLDRQLDIDFIDEINFWSFWSTNQNVWKYTQENVDPIVLKRADSPLIGAVFSIMYRSGINFSSGTEGSATGWQISNLQVDATKYGVWVTGNNTQGQIANFRSANMDYTFTSPVPGGNAYRDDSNSSIISIANFESFYSGGSAVNLTGSGSNLQISNMLTWNYNQDNNNSAAITLAAGNAATINSPPHVTGNVHGAPLVSVDPNALLYSAGISQSWTPMVVGTGTTGSATYSVQNGAFWNDGASIRANFSIDVSSHSGFSGNIGIGPLPLPIVGINYQDGICTIASHAGVLLDSNYYTMSGIMASGAVVNQMLLLQSSPGAPSLLIPFSNVESTFVLKGSCSYQWR